MPDPDLELDIHSDRTPSPGLEPYNPTRQHDWVRTIVTVGLLVPFLALVWWACRESAASKDTWERTKEMLQILLPAITGLLGSVIGFYFGSGSANTKR